MKVSTRTTDGVTIIDLDGPLHDGRRRLRAARQAVRDALEAGSTKILLNLAKATRIDSSGIGELVSSLTAAGRNNAKLKLENLPPKIQDVTFFITKLNSGLRRLRGRDGGARLLQVARVARRGAGS